MAEMQKQKGMKGLGKMGSDFESKPAPKKESSKGESGGAPEHEGGETVITHHGDGSHSVDGERHPTHLHAMAALGHKMTGGDKHHIMHHDGMSARGHMIHEDGQHDGPHEYNSAEDAKNSLSQFFDEEAAEPAHQHEEMPQEQPAYGGM